VEYSDQAVLEANEGYWELGYPKAETVIYENKLIGDRKEAMRLCREAEGAVDIVSHIRPLDTLKVAESPFAKVVKSKDISFLGGQFNQRKRNSKWMDVRLRKAVNYAINRQELLKYAARGNAYNLGGFIPPGAYGHNPSLTLYTYDTNKARALLAEAGYANGFEMKMITQEAWKLEAQIIGKMLERIGLKVKLQVLTHPEFYKRVYIPILDKPVDEQDWDIYILGLHDAYGHTGAIFLTFGYIEESDWRWIEYDPVYEKMWEKTAKTVDFEKQEEMIRELVKYTYERAYDIVVYSPLLLYAVNKEVNFVPQKSQFLRFKETSLTDNHWSLREQD